MEKMTTIDEMNKGFDKGFDIVFFSNLHKDGMLKTASQKKCDDLKDLVRNHILSLIGEVEEATEKLKKESESDKPAMLRELSNEFIVGYNSAIKDFLSLIRGMK